MNTRQLGWRQIRHSIKSAFSWLSAVFTSERKYRDGRSDTRDRLTDASVMIVPNQTICERKANTQISENDGRSHWRKICIIYSKSTIWRRVDHHSGSVLRTQRMNTILTSPVRWEDRWWTDISQISQIPLFWMIQYVSDPIVNEWLDWAQRTWDVRKRSKTSFKYISLFRSSRPVHDSVFPIYDDVQRRLHHI